MHWLFYNYTETVQYVEHCTCNSMKISIKNGNGYAFRWSLREIPFFPTKQTVCTVRAFFPVQRKATWPHISSLCVVAYAAAHILEPEERIFWSLQSPAHMQLNDAKATLFIYSPELLISLSSRSYCQIAHMIACLGVQQINKNTSNLYCICWTMKCRTLPPESRMYSCENGAVFEERVPRPFKMSWCHPSPHLSNWFIMHCVPFC